MRKIKLCATNTITAKIPAFVVSEVLVAMQTPAASMNHHALAIMSARGHQALAIMSAMMRKGRNRREECEGRKEAERG